MPGSDEPNEMREDDLAALEAYENSDEGQAQPAPDPAAELTKLFNKTPEMQEYIKTADSVANRLNPADTVTVPMQVPREFIRLTEFLEKKRAAAAGVEPSPTAAVLNQILLNELHAELHRMIADPAGFRYYRELWNRFCDEQGAADQKIVEPSAAMEEGEKGPF